MRSSDELVWIDRPFEGELARCGSGRHRRRLVGFENLKTSDLGVDDGERLESFRLEDLLVKPGLDFILGLFWQLLVIVVDVSVQLQQCDLPAISSWLDMRLGG
jgi:hypothetical protein